MDKDKLKLSEFEDTLIDARVTAPLTIAAALLIAVAYLTHTSYTTNPYLVWPTVVGLIIFSFTHFIPSLEFSKRHTLYLTAYHLVLAFIAIAIVPTLSSYLVLWILLGYLTDYFYQRPGLALTIIFMIASITVGVIYQNQPLTSGLFLETLPWLVYLSGVMLVMSKIVLGTKQYRATLAAKMAKAKYEHLRLVALINSMVEAVIAVDDTGKINIYNAAAIELFDTNTNIENHDLHDYLKLFDAKDDPVDVMKIAAETTYLSKRSEFYTLIGKEKIAVELNISRTTVDNPITHENGYTFLIRDITKQRSVEEEQSDFIAVVSHELRTPVAIAEANIAMAELTIKKQLGEDNQTMSSIKKAHDQVISLAEMVNDLSTLSRAEKDSNEMEIETFNITELFEELKPIYAGQIERKGLYLKFETEEALPAVITSKLYLKEIIQNLISNAIKYTQAGGVTIISKKVMSGQVQVSINDTGIGISKTEQKKVFEKFWRSEDPLTRESEGTGLGLHIAYKLAARIGSLLKFESKIGVGSTFYLDVPAVGAKNIETGNIVKNEVENFL